LQGLEWTTSTWHSWVQRKYAMPIRWRSFLRARNSQGCSGQAALRTTLLYLRHLQGGDKGRDPILHLLITCDPPDLHLTSTKPGRRRLLTQLQHAISLPRGAFLEGFSLCDAPSSTAGRASHVTAGICVPVRSSTTSLLQVAAEELASAIAMVTRWLILDPLQEDAYQRLMRLHFGSATGALLCMPMTCVGRRSPPTCRPSRRQKPWRWPAGAQCGGEYIDQALSRRATRPGAGGTAGRAVGGATAAG
jgi:hypothetical protein